MFFIPLIRTKIEWINKQRLILVGPIKQFESQRKIKQQKMLDYYYSRNSFKKHGQVLRNI